MHELNVYLVNENHSGWTRQFLSEYDAFAPGDDILLTFGRTEGLWTLSWDNQTNPAASGASPGISLPWLDEEEDLYVGVFAANAGTVGGTTDVVVSFTSEIDYFSVDVVPEPSSIVLLSIGALSMMLWGRRRRKS